MSNVKLIEVTSNAAGDITIKIPRSYIRHTVAMLEDLPEGSRVTNTKVFSDAVLSELRSEQEDGTTLVHVMLDAAVLEAVEQGAEGVKLGDEE